MVWTPNGKLKALFAYLVVCMGSARGIPFAKPWGTDLHNLHIYTLCAANRNPYLISGKDCGYIYQRILVYPPLLFRSFFWPRGLPLETAMYYWCSAILFMLAVSFWCWLRLAKARPSWDVLLFCGLLTFQYPTMFLLERGGTDMVSV